MNGVYTYICLDSYRHGCHASDSFLHQDAITSLPCEGFSEMKVFIGQLRIIILGQRLEACSGIRCGIRIMSFLVISSDFVSYREMLIHFILITALNKT